MNEFSAEERRELLELARATIDTLLRRHKKESPTTVRESFQSKRGVFVTLHRRGELRGCIGYPLPYKPLAQAVVDNAVSAATEDPRFPAVTLAELAEIDIEISVLTVPQPVSGPEEVVVGRDGIIISKGARRGLLLPQVPLEQGWNRDEYLSYGCMKAGLPADEWRRGVGIETFQAEVFGEKERPRKGNE